MVHSDSNDPMYVEWRAWQLVVQEMRSLGIEPNDERADRLCRVISAWGELLAELRSTQDEQVVTEARTHALFKVLNVGIRTDFGTAAAPR